jgi:hypothetical protein
MNSQPRCPIRGCFIRYRGGDDRLCPIHQQEHSASDWQARMDEAAMATGDSDGDHDTSTEGAIGG